MYTLGSRGEGMRALVPHVHLDYVEGAGHMLPLTQLVILTSSAEWRVTSLNSDAITPSTISVRPQSYIGASNVQPAIVN
ncbi:MAG: hypothetical protein ACK5HM_14395, partial [Gemmatimonas sp.]|uniref:hypothetical protein n=1 Tax=Gemmatimonas sp. TaxID=1962908 RepID=UPI00391C9D78